MKRDLKMFVLGLLAAVSGTVLAQSWSVFSGVRFSQNGSDMTPALSWTSDQNSGLYRIGADDIALGVAGAAASSGFLELNASSALLAGGGLSLIADSSNITLQPMAGDVSVDLSGGGSMLVNNLIAGTVGDTFPGLTLGSTNGEMQFIPSRTGGSEGRINIWDETSTRVPLYLDSEQVTFHLGAAGGVDAVMSASGYNSAGWLRSATDGNNTTPTHSFANSTNSGMYLVSAGNVGFTAGGTLGMQLSSGTLQTFNTALTFNGVVTTDNTSADEVGYKGIPQNSQSGNYTLVLTDSAYHIYHPSGGGAGDTFTIPANSSVAYPVGTVVTFINDDSNSISIAITTDTMTLAGTTTTGTRTLAENGVATAVKVTSTSWIINGTGLT